VGLIGLIRLRGIVLLRDDVMFSSFDTQPQVPMAVVPNLAEQQMLGLKDFEEPSWLREAIEVEIIVSK
jgi:hypothetical protein